MERIRAEILVEIRVEILHRQSLVEVVAGTQPAVDIRQLVDSRPVVVDSRPAVVDSPVVAGHSRDYLDLHDRDIVISLYRMI